MPRMSDSTPLGRLLKARRVKNKVSWKRLERVVGLEDQTMMRWERGVTKDPPISKVLLYAREVGISLTELADAALPPSGGGSGPSGPVPARENTVEQVSARDKKKKTGARARTPQQSPHRRDG